MPIFMIEGTLGSGKSYEAVAFHILTTLEKGRKVITNMPLNLEHFKNVYGEDILKLIKLIHPTAQNPVPFKTIQDWQDDWRDEKTLQSAFFVVDECHKALGRGRTDLKVEEFLAESRHNGHDVLLITQGYGKISKTVCDMLQLLYRVRKNTALGAPKSYVRKVFDGVKGAEVNTSIRFYDAKYYPFYKSHTQSESAVIEAVANDVIPIWRNWTFLGAAILLPIGIYLLLTNPMPFMPDNSKPILQKPVQHSPAVAQTPQTQPQQPNSTTTTQQQMESKTKEQDKVEANHPYYKLQMHIGGYIESEKITENVKSLFMYNVLLSQNGQVMARITDKDLTKAGYQLDALGSCLFKITYKQFFDYITCDAPTVSPNSEKNFEQKPQQNKVAVNP